MIPLSESPADAVNPLYSCLRQNIYKQVRYSLCHLFPSRHRLCGPTTLALPVATPAIYSHTDKSHHETVQLLFH